MAGEIVVGVLRATIGLLMDEGRDWLAQKLKEGDVTDENFVAGSFGKSML